MFRLVIVSVSIHVVCVALNRTVAEEAPSAMSRNSGVREAALCPLHLGGMRTLNLGWIDVSDNL
jgi:hypothetical protein